MNIKQAAACFFIYNLFANMKSLFQQYSRFYTPYDVQQQADQIIDVTGWPIGGDFMPYAEGTRPKFELFCPPDIDAPFLIPDHRYLYKKTIQRKSKDPTKQGYIHYEQFWVEIVAYHLGRALGVEVPPAFVTCRELPDGELEYAALIEWYYGYPSGFSTMVFRGGELMSRAIHGYDREKGLQHNFLNVAGIMESKNINSWFAHWVRMLCFDALLGNTDRHQENWEMIAEFDLFANSPDAIMYLLFLSPAFDNGTALGYEVIPENIGKTIAKLDSYIAKGTHHLKWKIDDEKQQGHFELLANLIAFQPQAKDIMAELLHCDLTALYDSIRDMTRYDIRNEHYRLTPERAEFMIALLRARQQKAKETINA